MKKTKYILLFLESLDGTYTLGTSYVKNNLHEIGIKNISQTFEERDLLEKGFSLEELIKSFKENDEIHIDNVGEYIIQEIQEDIEKQNVFVLTYVNHFGKIDVLGVFTNKKDLFIKAKDSIAFMYKDNNLKEENYKLKDLQNQFIEKEFLEIESIAEYKIFIQELL